MLTVCRFSQFCKGIPLQMSTQFVNAPQAFVVRNGSLECRKSPSTKKFSPIILTVSRSIMMSEIQDMQKKRVSNVQKRDARMIVAELLSTFQLVLMLIEQIRLAQIIFKLSQRLSSSPLICGNGTCIYFNFSVNDMYSVFFPMKVSVNLKAS